MRTALFLCFVAGIAQATEKAPAYGDHALIALDDDAYIDPATSPEERARVRSDRATARARLVEAIGPIESAAPRELYCKTDECMIHFAGPSRRSRVRMPGDAPQDDGTVDRPTIVMTRVADITGTLVHEIFHIELAHRLGSASVPAWFNEGMAAHFGDNTPGCTAQSPNGIDDLRRLAHAGLWFTFTELRGRIGLTYCQARHEVEAWLAQGGTARFLALVQKVRDGGDFATLYGPMLTQGNGAFPTVIMSEASEIGEAKRPFSFALWVKPTTNEGTLVHVSSTTAGTGWCDPFLGFDATHALVAQVNHDGGPAPTAYTIARSPTLLPLHRWSHVAMTWAPDASLRLYVNGREVASTKSSGYHASGDPSMYVTWGSQNIAGPTACWQGAIAGRRFAGEVMGTRVLDRALDAAEIVALAKNRP